MTSLKVVKVISLIILSFLCTIFFFLFHSFFTFCCLGFLLDMFSCSLCPLFPLFRSMFPNFFCCAPPILAIFWGSSCQDCFLDLVHYFSFSSQSSLKGLTDLCKEFLKEDFMVGFFCSWETLCQHCYLYRSIVPANCISRSFLLLYWIYLRIRFM